MTVKLGPVEFDEETIKRELSRDLRDDWFPDPRRFEDMLDSNHIAEVLAENFRKNNGSFQARRRTLLNVPKSNFTLRYGLEISLAERALYHALVSRLVVPYDELIPWNVFSHRSQSDRRYLFRHAVRAWQDFTGVVRNSLPADGVLLSTDLANYYEDISLGLLRDTFLELLPELAASPEEKADIRVHIGALVDHLGSWSYSTIGGLPQNRDASSFLANVFMLPVDRAMLGRGYLYFRYMDDIKIACASEHDARKALKLLSLALRERGLSVNSGKTQIIPMAEPARINKSLDVGEPALQQMDSVWQTRSLRPISRSFQSLSDLTQRLLRDGSIDSRAFRFCIKRLEILASCPEFEVPDAYFSPITSLVIDSLARHPAATDQLSRYLRAVPTNPFDLKRVADILTDEARNFYTWQCYQLWVLLVHKKYSRPSLVAAAMDVLRNQPDNPTRCGATLYAGAFGSGAERVEIAQRFGDLTSFIGQRTALLAIQELHFRPHIEEHVRPVLRDDLKNVYRRLDRSGVYVAAPEQVPITRYVDTERDYD